MREDSDIRKVADLRGRSFAFGDELSTIGRYVPQYYLSRAGITNSDLSRIEYLGRHDRVGTAVASRQFDAGSLETTMILKLVAEGAPLRVLATFRSLPRTWIARAGLDARLVAALALTLIEMRDPTALKALRAGDFLAAEDADYEETREAIRENNRFFAGTTPRTN